MPSVGVNHGTAKLNSEMELGQFVNCSKFGFGTRFWPHCVPGGVVSCVVTVWLHVWLLPQPSKICQFRVKAYEHGLLLTTLSVVVMLTPQQDEITTGESKLQSLPHSTVLFVGQTTVSFGVGVGGTTMKVTV